MRNSPALIASKKAVKFPRNSGIMLSDIGEHYIKLAQISISPKNWASEKKWQTRNDTSYKATGKQKIENSCCCYGIELFFGFVTTESLKHIFQISDIILLIKSSYWPSCMFCFRFELRNDPHEDSFNQN